MNHAKKQLQLNIRLLLPWPCTAHFVVSGLLSSHLGIEPYESHPWAEGCTECFGGGERDMSFRKEHELSIATPNSESPMGKMSALGHRSWSGAEDQQEPALSQPKDGMIASVCWANFSHRNDLRETRGNKTEVCKHLILATRWGYSLSNGRYN